MFTEESFDNYIFTVISILQGIYKNLKVELDLCGLNNIIGPLWANIQT